MDKNTFSNSKAAQNLVGILEQPENLSYCSAVSSLLSRCQQEMRAIMTISNLDLRRTILTIWRHRFVDLVKAREFPDIIETHTLCVVVGFYRKLQREIKLDKGVDK